MKPLQAWPAIEVGVEAHQGTDRVPFHHCYVYRIPCRYPCGAKHDIACPDHVHLLDRQHFVDNAESCMECGCDRLTPVNRSVPVEDLLQNFGTSHETLPGGDESLYYQLRLHFVRMRRAHKVHRDVGIDKDQLS